MIQKYSLYSELEKSKESGKSIADYVTNMTYFDVFFYSSVIMFIMNSYPRDKLWIAGIISKCWKCQHKKILVVEKQPWVFQHDNASIHALYWIWHFGQILDHIESILLQPPYSPNLLQHCFFLFLKLKSKMIWLMWLETVKNSMIDLCVTLKDAY